MNIPNFSLEAKFGGIIAGVDEAGRGPWAGPVVAGVVIFKNCLETAQIKALDINDSKKISEKKRELIFEQLIKADFIDYGIGIAESSEIDEFNVLNATKLAMLRAVENLNSTPSMVLIDGNQKVHNLPYPQETIIKGDSKSLSIAAGSIIAKVTRDRIMRHLAAEFPQYGWERNKGYGTKDHSDAIAEHGITEHHRKSFAPIRKYIEDAEDQEDIKAADAAMAEFLKNPKTYTLEEIEEKNDL
jgi:ribonuclease HII